MRFPFVICNHFRGSYRYKRAVLTCHIHMLVQLFLIETYIVLVVAQEPKLT